jgi:phosphoribosylformylglycinamidine synthase
VALAESAMPRGLGFDVSTDENIRRDAFLFGESQGRIVVSVAPEQEDHFIEAMMQEECEFSFIGIVTSGEVLVDEEPFGNILEMKALYDTALENLLK